MAENTKVEPLSTDELKARLHHVITEARQFGEELSDDRAVATRYYNAEKFGDEEEGRSQYIDSTVRDTVQAMLPSLLRVFFGTEQAVEFVPRRADGVAGAEQATRAAQYIFAHQNPGLLLTHSVLLDGLVRKLGVFKWAYERNDRVTTHTLENATPEQIQMLAQEGVEFVQADQNPDGTVNLRFTRTEEDGKIVVYAVPGEEFVFTREARSPDDGLFLGHVREVPRGELLAMGIDEDLLDEWGHADGELTTNSEEIARREANQEPGGTGDDPEAGPENEKILYVEGYLRSDLDGTGLKVWKVCTVGPSYHPCMEPEEADHIPFSVFTPRPEPHTMVGQSIADATMDLQLLRSRLMRSTLDSLALSIYPRTAYVEGMVSAADVLNTEIGAPLRVRGTNAVGNAIQEFGHTFVGKEALPFVALTDDMIERRTGINKGAAGMDADALQSTTKGGVEAAVTQSQAQQELIARLFAETALKPLFLGIYRLLLKHQPRKQIVRLNGQWVEIDPRTWDADMDVIVNVALGTGFTEQKIAGLLSIAEKQEQMLMTAGLTNPLITVGQYGNTLRKIVELLGWKDTTQFINPLPADWTPPPAPPQPSPEQQLVELEVQKAQIQMQTKQQELQMKQAEMQMKMQMQEAELSHKIELEREKLRAEVELKVKEMELKYQVAIEEARIHAAIESRKAAMQAETEQYRAERAADTQDRAVDVNAETKRVAQADKNRQEGSKE